MKVALLALLFTVVSSSQLLNSVNEVNLEETAFASRMAGLSDEAKKAASEIAALFFSSFGSEDGVSDAEALDMFLALPISVQHELKHAFPEFFDDLDEETEQKLDAQSRAFGLN